MRQVWSALSAIAALIAVTVAFDGKIAGPVLLAMAVVVAVAGRRDAIARWAALGFAIAGGGLLPELRAAELAGRGDRDEHAPPGISTLVSSLLVGRVRGGDRLVVG